MRWRRADGLLAVIAVVVAAGCIRLGLWQLDRRAQRRALNDRIAARLALPPVALDTVRAGIPAESLAGRRVTARGSYDYEAEFLWRGRSFDGTPGVGLVTPLRLAGGTVVFVDRGWVPSPDASTVPADERRRYREPDPTTPIAGMARTPPRGRSDVQIPDSGFLPVVLQVETPAAVAGLPRRWYAPALDDGPHLGYAIQWFSFALIALVGTAVLLRKSARTQGLSP